MKPISLIALTFSLFFLMLPEGVLADIAESRANVEKLNKDDNFKDALELGLKHFREVSDEKSAADLSSIVISMYRLRKYDAYDEVVELVDAMHGENVGVLLEMSATLQSNHLSRGRWVDNQFIRGGYYDNVNAGVYANSTARNRVQAMLYAERALALAENDAERLLALKGLSSALLSSRRGSHSWMLQVLTDTEVLPEVEEGYSHTVANAAPLTKDGDPVFYWIPESYELAKSDGERYRWLLQEIQELSGENNWEVAREWAGFLREQFGVQTLRQYQWYYQLSSEHLAEKTGLMQVHTLKDNETLAKMANTVKRFELPDEQNYLKIYQDAWEAGDDQSGEVLVQIYQNRKMYKRAAKMLRQLIENHGDVNKDRKYKLEQIEGDWCEFVRNQQTYTLNEKKKLTVDFRNATSVKLSVYPVKLQKLQDDIWAYTKSNPVKLDNNQWNLPNLLQYVRNGEERPDFVGEMIGQKEYALQPAEDHWNKQVELELPELKKPGAYIVKSELGNGREMHTVVWVNDMLVVSRGVSGGTLYYVTDAVTGAPIAGATFDFRGYKKVNLKKVVNGRRSNILTKTFTKTADEFGVVVLEGVKSDFQYMLEVKQGERRAWMQFSRLQSYYNDRFQTYQSRKAFGMTSQPVYKPQSKVQGKFWVRNVGYNIKEVSRFAGVKFRVEIYDPKGAQVGESQQVKADDFGGVSYMLDLAEDATLGMYQVRLYQGSSNSSTGVHHFRVEEYKKPEYEVIVDAPKVPVQLGEEFEAKVTARYYHGAPVTNAQVKVKVLRTKYTERWYPSGRWDWLYGKGYGWLDVDRHWYPGWYRWGCFSPYPHWYHRNHEQPEVVLDEKFQIGKDGSVQVKIDSALAQLVHKNDDHRYEIKVEVTDASRRTIFGSGSVLATRKPYNVTTWLSRGYALTGQKIEANVAARTLDGRAVTGTGTMVLKQVNFDADGNLTEEDVEKWELETIAATPADDGRFEKVNVVVDQPGQYRLVSLVQDEKGREVEGAVLFTVMGVTGEEKLTNVRYNDLELIPDKRTYAVGEKLKLLVNTKREDSIVMLFVKGTKDRRMIKVNGRSSVVEIPITANDMPNFFVEAITVSNGLMHKMTKEVIVPPSKRTLNVEVLPSSEKYKPGEEGSVKVRVTGEDGEPVQGSCVLSVYDKSLEYISGGSNVDEIRSFFWKWRRRYQQTYWRQALALYGDVAWKSNKGRMLQLSGHDGSFQTLSESQGDPFFGRGRIKHKGSKGLRAGAVLSAIESRKNEGGTADVAGSTTEVVVRKDFADLIQWSGELILNEDGVAEVPVEYPDNLTTWKIKTWAMAHGSRVGEGSAEVITSKDLIIRLQAPRYFVEKDEVVLSGVVHNYLDTAQQAKVSLELEGGTLEVIDGEIEQSVHLAAKQGEERVDWRVKVKGEGEALVRMKVITGDDSDAMEMTFPVYVHGILKQMAWSREIAPEEDSVKIEIEVPEERRPEDSKLEVRYSPTIAGAIVDALPYLAEYPYGCTEQTLNRFVPTVITQKLLQDMGIDLEDVRNKRTNLNPQELGDDQQRAKQWKRWRRNPVFSENEVGKMVSQGVQKLAEMQVSDGGWGWFSGYGEQSYPHTTAVVVHGLKQAKDNGAQVPDQVLERGIAWLKKFEAKQVEMIRMYKKRKKNTKSHATTMDVFVRLVLAENGISNQDMLDFQHRDKSKYGLYAKSLLAMNLHLAKDVERRDGVIHNIEQFLKYDEENQTAYLEMSNRGYWWYWYGNEIEAHAWYLKLLAAVKPESKQARGVVKYLINNRKHATYWDSTRDTAYCIEAIADYMKATGENDPNVEVEVLVDGKSYKKVSITKENLFSFDNKMTLGGDVLSTGKHEIEIRKKSKGPLYTNAYLTVFTKEDFIEKAGLEVKVERRFYKLVPKDSTTAVAGDHGQVVNQKTDAYDREPLKVGDSLASGDIIEVELLVDSKNDYEYLMFSDYKAAGTEAEEVRSGYLRSGSLYAYMEVRDEKVCFFVRQLSRGKHSVSYRLRAEIPGKFSALPATADAMYAPELRANSDEMKLQIVDE